MVSPTVQLPLKTVDGHVKFGGLFGGLSSVMRGLFRLDEPAEGEGERRGRDFVDPTEFRRHFTRRNKVQPPFHPPFFLHKSALISSQ